MCFCGARKRARDRGSVEKWWVGTVVNKLASEFSASPSICSSFMIWMVACANTMNLFWLELQSSARTKTNNIQAICHCNGEAFKKRKSTYCPLSLPSSTCCIVIPLPCTNKYSPISMSSLFAHCTSRLSVHECQCVLVEWHWFVPKNVRLFLHGLLCNSVAFQFIRHNSIPFTNNSIFSSFTKSG